MLTNDEINHAITVVEQAHAEGRIEERRRAGTESAHVWHKPTSGYILIGGDAYQYRAKEQTMPDVWVPFNPKTRTVGALTYTSAWEAQDALRTMYRDDAWTVVKVGPTDEK